MKRPIRRMLAFYTTEKQARALLRIAGPRKKRPLLAVVREAVAEYLERHAAEKPPDAIGSWQRGTVPGSGKGPPRIMLHLRDRKRLKLLRLQSKTFKGTHRSVGRVIRAAIDEYLKAHEHERRQLLQRQRRTLGKKGFSAWKREVERGPRGEERDSVSGP